VVAEPQNVVRMNISVPRDLKARMDSATKYLLPGTVNWSAVASAAFEAKLLDLASKKETGTMEDVIARLKAAEEADSNEQRQEGAEAGRAWARNVARPRQLRRLARLGKKKDAVEDQLSGFNADTKHGIATSLYAVLHDLPVASKAFGTGDVAYFWLETVGPGGRAKMDDIDFASGFCDGAREVWEKVKDSL
jgi:hypothetical protein